MLHRTRHLFIRQQTSVINAIRAHFAEFGMVARVGRNGVAEFDRQIMAWLRSNETSKRLDAIPGVGPALAITLTSCQECQILPSTTWHRFRIKNTKVSMSGSFMSLAMLPATRSPRHAISANGMDRPCS
jgi:hypothetical protein